MTDVRVIKKGNKYFLDGSRQWPRSIDETASIHRIRYKFAAALCSGRTLDAACGVGYGSHILGRSAEVVGIDQSDAAIAWANKFFQGPSYICGDVLKSPWDGVFETVVSLETIEHLQDPCAALKAFRRSCNGLIASVPNEELYQFDAEQFRDDESPHFRHYTPDEFSELLGKNGFRVLERYCQKDKLNPNVVAGTAGKFLIYVCK